MTDLLDADPPLPEGAFYLPTFSGLTLPQAYWGKDHVDTEDSGFGASYHSVLMMCPRKFFFANVERLKPAAFGEMGISARNHSLLRGWLMHACCEVYYKGGMSDAAIQEVYTRLDAVAQVHEYADLVAEADNLWGSYLDRYKIEDRLNYDVAAVEHPMHIRDVIDGEEFLYTIRADLILKHRTNGLYYVFEHKNLSSYGDNERTGYLLDLQIQGEAWTFTKSHPELPFGGVVINVTVCNKTPAFYRQTVCFNTEQMRNFGQQMRSWSSMRAGFQMAGWPQNFSACKTRYPGSRGGLCDYHSLCTHGFKVGDIRGREPPPGFVRQEKLVKKENLG